MTFEIFSPDTIKNTIHKAPTLSISRKSGLININASARQNILGNDTHFYMVHAKEERTTYLVPSPSTGFAFRECPKSKSLRLTHKELARKILENNSQDGAQQTFRIATLALITIDSNLIEAYPLIKTI